MSTGIHELTDAEIAGYMNWRGPGAYTQHSMRRVKAVVAEAVRREQEACAALVEQDLVKKPISDYQEQYNAGVRRVATSIRARGTAQPVDSPPLPL